MNFPDLTIENSNQQTISDSLESIAEDLILKRALSVNEHLYSFVDLEIYYWHENHRDKYAKGIPHNRPKGQFEIHRFGIDLSLGNNEIEGLGGILLCGLYDLTDQKRIPKPEVIKAIFNQMKIGNDTFSIIERRMQWEKVFKSKRQNLGEPGNDPDKLYFRNAMYKFLAKDRKLFIDCKGKEKIIRESNLDEIDKYGLLNYAMKQ